MNTATLCQLDPAIAELKLDQMRREVRLQSVVVPGAVAILRQVIEPSVRRFYIREHVKHTDRALMEYCGCNEYLGGRVERHGRDVCVVRYTS